MKKNSHHIYEFPSQQQLLPKRARLPITKQIPNSKRCAGLLNLTCCFLIPLPRVSGLIFFPMQSVIFSSLIQVVLQVTLIILTNALVYCRQRASQPTEFREREHLSDSQFFQLRLRQREQLLSTALFVFQAYFFFPLPFSFASSFDLWTLREHYNSNK